MRAGMAVTWISAGVSRLRIWPLLRIFVAVAVLLFLVQQIYLLDGSRLQSISREGLASKAHSLTETIGSAAGKVTAPIRRPAPSPAGKAAQPGQQPGQPGPAGSKARPATTTNATTNTTTSPNSTDSAFPKSRPPPAPPCGPLPGIQDIYVAYRTGATETPVKLGAQLNTTLRCVPHLGLYSDLEEDWDGHHLYDTLADVHADFRERNAQFDVYRRLHADGRAAFSRAELDAWSNAKNTASGKDSPFWKLDKWKFIPMAAKSLANAPNSTRWFLFTESDTYIIWGTVLHWLANHDSTKRHYLGLQMALGDQVFAYGGAGFAISRPALEAAVDKYRRDVRHWEDITAGGWAGDAILAALLRDVGVNLEWAWPTLTGDKPTHTGYHPQYNHNPWCFYVGSYHHFEPSELVEFDAWVRGFQNETKNLPRHKDVFDQIIRPQLAGRLENWTNLIESPLPAADPAKPWPGRPHEDEADCRRACEQQAGCMSFLFKTVGAPATADGDGNNKAGAGCFTSDTFRLGHRRDAASDTLERCVSGFMLDRIAAWVDRQETCPEHGRYQGP